MTKPQEQATSAREPSDSSRMVVIGSNSRITFGFLLQLGVLVVGLVGVYIALNSKIDEMPKSVLKDVDEHYVTKTFAEARFAALADSQNRAIELLSKDLNYMQRDVSEVKSTVKELPAITFQLKDLQRTLEAGSNPPKK